MGMDSNRKGEPMSDKTVTPEHIEALKRGVSSILMGALDGTNPSYRLPKEEGGYLRWGKVEQSIHATIDESLQPHAETAMPEWHEGPANGGEGTAGGNMWIDGEELLVIIELRDGDREVLSVIINADGNQASMVMNGSGDDTGWDLFDIYWWARVSDLNLPPKEGRKE